MTPLKGLFPIPNTTRRYPLHGAAQISGSATLHRRGQLARYALGQSHSRSIAITRRAACTSYPSKVGLTAT